MKHWVLIALLSGCAFGDPDDDEMESLKQAATSLNGVSLNGVSLNGVSLNGVSLNGVSLNGVSLNGVSLNGVTLNASKISAKNPAGQTITGAALVGSTFSGTLSNGTTMNLRVDSVTQGTGVNADMWLYGVSYENAGTWARLCGSDTSTPSKPILATPVTGEWNYATGVTGGGSYTADPARFTFACRGTAIAKCVEMGYKQWKTAGGVNLQNHMVACTRMLRADYCGNGTSYTANGKQVDLYDNLGVQIDTQGWNIEAEWTASGARCVAYGLDTRLHASAKYTVACYNAKKSYSCGSRSNFGSGTLIMSETNY